MGFETVFLMHKKEMVYHTHGIARNSNNLNLKERTTWQLKQKLKFQMILNSVKY